MSETIQRQYFGLLIASFGIAFAVAGLTLWFVTVRPRTTELNQAVLGIVAHVLFGYIVVMSGIVLVRSELPATQCFVTTKWCFGGAGFMGFLVAWRALPDLRTGTVTFTVLNELVIVGSVGAAAGALVGLNRAQAIRNRQLANNKQDREETLVFLLRLLDHDIQNHLVAISNHADAVRPSTFDPSPTPVEAIQERTASIERLLETANVVLESETGTREFDRVDLAVVLSEQLGVVRSESPAVDIDADIEAELYVESDQFIGEVFRNILDNAVVHNSPSELTITVTARAVDDAIEVEIADDGGGIPAGIRENLFDPGVRGSESPGDGIGLYLVRKLIVAYQGSVSVSDRSPSGTRFLLQFPRTEAPAPE